MEDINNNTLDIDFYKSYYPDLQHLSPQELVVHYNLFGKNEGRISNKSGVDTDFYKAYYPDLQNLSSQDLVVHYNLFGKNEGRISNKSGLDTDFYKSYYPDLQNLSSQDLVLHYNLFGKNEGRVTNRLNFEKTLYKQRCENPKYKDVIIYLHLGFDLRDGGVTVQCYLANILDTLGVRCKVIGLNNESNILFNNKYTDDFDVNECIVIYCEGIQGNPLHAKNVVRWMLSPLGKNVPYHFIHTWNKNELVYYFNPELRFEKHLIGIKYKMLTCPYLNPNIKNYNTNKRYGTCFHYRKTQYYNKITVLHKETDFEIYRHHTQEDYIEFFNKYKFFILYDPLSFLTIISIMCGCVTIVHPVEGQTKLEWLHTTFYSLYLTANNLNNIYGIAYGVEDIDYAKSTVHLAYEQTMGVIRSFIDDSVKPFLNDINNFEQMTNTLANNYDL
jgi:hypothetical protein